MPQKTPDGRLLPKTKYERFLKLQSHLYALRFQELRKKLCAKDRDELDRAFTAASLEVNSLVPERIEFDEERYRNKHQKEFDALEGGADTVSAPRKRAPKKR